MQCGQGYVILYAILNTTVKGFMDKLNRKAYSFKLDITNEQDLLLRSFNDILRMVYNSALEHRTMHWNQWRNVIRYEDQAAEITISKLKKDPDLSFVSSLPSQVIQQKLIDLDLVFKEFWRRGFGYPKFKRKKDENGSMRFPVDRVKFKESTKFHHKRGVRGSGYIVFPKIGKLKIRQSRKVEGKIKNFSIVQSGEQWFVSIQVEFMSSYKCNKGGELGIDRGVNVPFATSSGLLLGAGMSSSIKLYEKKLKKQQRMLFNKEKFSKNWYKQKQKVRTTYSKIKNIRKDYIEKLSTQITKNNSFVAMELLQVKNMVKSVKGELDVTSRDVKAKSKLNREILRIGWSQFSIRCDQKSQINGCKVSYVNSAYTSQECANCGCIEKENRKGDAFNCVNCNQFDHSDINAAKVILKRALGYSVLPKNKATSMEEVSLETSLK